MRAEAAQKDTAKEISRAKTSRKITAQAPAISKRSLILLKGEQGQLSVRNPGGQIVWTSSNKKVADVSTAGQVTARRKRTGISTEAAGLKVGGYWFSTALTMRQAEDQRKLCLKKIRGKKFDFCQAVKKEGIKPGFYIEHRYIGPYLSPEIAQKKGYFQWIREIGTTNHYKSSYNMWQQSIGRVSGISGQVDLNYYFPAEENGVG